MSDDYISIDYEEISSAVTCLADNHYEIIKNLNNDSEILKSYQLIKYIITSCAKNSHASSKSLSYKHLLKTISKEYRPTSIYPGTVGAFLFGCSQRHYGDVSKQCSPLCINSIKTDEDISPDQHCEHQIWLQHETSGNSRFSHMNRSHQSNKAYIYVKENFDGFTSKEISTLIRADITQAKILITKKSKHILKLDWTDIQNLPKKGATFWNEIEKQNQDIQISTNTHSSTKKSNFWIFGLIVLIILFAIFVFKLILFK